MDIESMNRAIKDSFSRVKQDFINTRLWFNYFLRRFSQNEQEHSQIRDFLLEQQKFNHNISEILKNLSTRISGLNSEFDNLLETNKSVIKDNSQIKSSLSEIKLLYSNVSDLFKVVQAAITKGYVRDMSGTYPGHDKDMTTIEGKSKNDAKIKIVKKELLQGSEKYRKKVWDMNELTTSEKYILRILINSSKPLSYPELSRMTTRKEKTIRNIIYNLRRKGFDIRDEFTAPKEKVFFLPDSLRIILSGR